MKITILGCGSSGGVPLIGGADGRGYWGACDPANPKNQRTRASIYVEIDGLNILVDTSPDLRQQCLRTGITRLDAVLYTHNHADHLLGVDDLRAFNFQAQAPLIAYTDAFYAAQMRTSFPYIFADFPKHGDYYKPAVELRTITPPEPFQIQHTTIQPFYQHHGKVDSIGYRIGKMAYSTDVRAFPVASEPYLEGLDLWIVDCVQYEPHPTHAHLELTLSWIERFKPKRAILTHLNYTMDYAVLQRALPEGVEVAFDGWMGKAI